jgi:hypothetical protein
MSAAGLYRLAFMDDTRTARTTCRMSISVDSFVAGPDQGPDNPVGVGALRLHE